jgi:hypothetical protein
MLPARDLGFLEHVFPSFFNGDKDEVLKSKITEQGKLTQFSYLQDFVDGK